MTIATEPRKRILPTTECPNCGDTFTHGALAQHASHCTEPVLPIGLGKPRLAGYLVRDGERVAPLTVTVVYERGRAIVYGD